jgi:hypothetical protein
LAFVIWRESTMSDADWSHDKICELVHDLESLRGGSLAAATLIGCGSRAIEPLRDFLLRGKPRGIFQPRQLAVETLAELGAKDVLLEYLQQVRTQAIKDAVVRFGEAVVESAAARALSRWLTDGVFRVLRELSLDRLLVGLAETLGEFRRSEMIPYFLWALGDDECREAADEALRKLGDEAHPQLINAVKNSVPTGENKVPSSRVRRRRALRILADESISTKEWKQLQNLQEENDPDIVITCSRMALNAGQAEDKQKAVDRLLDCLAAAGWFLKTEARSCLAEHFEAARAQIEREIEHRTSASGAARSLDVTLRILVNLKAQAESRCGRKAENHAEPKRRP